MRTEGAVILREQTAPATPAAGKLSVYAKTDHKLYFKGSDGVETLAGGSSAAAVPWEPQPANQPLLIKHGQDIPWMQVVGANKALHDQIFDGWVVNAFGYDAKFLDPAQTVTKAQIDTEVATFPTGMHKATHNFIRAIFAVPLDWFSDTQWTAITANFSNLAQSMAASNRQFDGIFIDTEYYGTGQAPWDYGTATPGAPWTFSASLGATPNQTAVAARAKVIARGKQIMDAITAAWPTVKIITTYGPWVSETLTGTALASIPGYNDVAYVNELMGCFIYGLVQSTYTNTSAQVIDGGEMYFCRTPEHFKTFREWQKVGFARSGTPIIPSGEEQQYMNAVATSVGVYDKDSLNAFATQPDARIGELVTMGAKSVDKYMWLYTEVNEWGASGSGKTAVPNSLRDSVRNGIREAQRDEWNHSVIDRQIVSTDTTNLREWRDSTNALLSYVDYLGRVREGGRRLANLTSRLTTVATIASATATSTGLVLTFEANKIYEIEFAGFYQQSVTGNTYTMQFAFSGTMTAMKLHFRGNTGSTAFASSTMTALNSAGAGLAASAATTDNHIWIKGLFRVGASAGNLTLNHARSAGSGTITLSVDSYLKATEMA